LPSTDTSTSRDLLERVGHALQSVFVGDGVHKGDLPQPDGNEIGFCGAPLE
jgi:hypothetical protein